MIVLNDDKIIVGDLIIDTEKIDLDINSVAEGNIVKCTTILDDNYLVWASLDGKTLVCDNISTFKKVDVSKSGKSVCKMVYDIEYNKLEQLLNESYKIDKEIAKQEKVVSKCMDNLNQYKEHEW